jgi:thiol-disulfide isomerase/thioredoxin
MALLCLAGKGVAQCGQPPVRPLTVGDTLPDMRINHLYNYPTASIHLSQLKDTYVLLDFWSTRCGSCIESIPEMHALQERYKGKLQVLMINSYAADTKQKLEKFFAWRKQRTGQSFSLTYALEDTVLMQRFPHETIPHYVWLNKDRRVAAITDQEALTDNNIRNWLSGQQVCLPLKNDALLFDEHKEQLDSSGGRDIVYRSLITGFKEGLGAAIGNRTTLDELVQRYYIINYSLLQLYSIAYREVFAVPYNRIIIHDSIAGLAKQLFCYDLVTRPISREAATAALRTDLWRSFAITACSEYRLMDCYVLSASEQVKKCLSKGGVTGSDTDSLTLKKYIRNSPVSELLSVLGRKYNRPWVDETGLQQNIDISFPYDFFRYSLQQVKDFLLGYGLLMTPAKRSLQVAVLKPNRAAE